jgi:hypothetical protein
MSRNIVSVLTYHRHTLLDLSFSYSIDYVSPLILGTAFSSSALDTQEVLCLWILHTNAVLLWLDQTSGSTPTSCSEVPRSNLSLEIGCFKGFHGFLPSRHTNA